MSEETPTKIEPTLKPIEDAPPIAAAAPEAPAAAAAKIEIKNRARDLRKMRINMDAVSRLPASAAMEFGTLRLSCPEEWRQRPAQHPSEC